MEWELWKGKIKKVDCNFNCNSAIISLLYKKME